MKKIILLAFLLVPILSFSQVFVKASILDSSLPGEEVFKRPGIGYTFGAGYAYPFTHFLKLEAGLRYLHKENNGGDLRIKSDYIDLLVVPKFYIRGSNTSAKLILGLGFYNGIRAGQQKAGFVRNNLFLAGSHIEVGVEFGKLEVTTVFERSFWSGLNNFGRNARSLTIGLSLTFFPFTST